MSELSSTDLLLEFLKQGGKSAVENLEKLNNQLQELKKANEEANVYHSMIADKLKQNKAAEYEVMNLHSALLSEQEKFEKSKLEFAADKFKVKKEIEYVEATQKLANETMAACELKLKRVLLDEERLKDLESSLYLKRQKFDMALKQVEKIMDEVI